jgi:hypothetical protein
VVHDIKRGRVLFDGLNTHTTTPMKWQGHGWRARRRLVGRRWRPPVRTKEEHHYNFNL